MTRDGGVILGTYHLHGVWARLYKSRRHLGYENEGTRLHIERSANTNSMILSSEGPFPYICL